MPDPEHDTAIQMNLNFDWMLKKVDEAHRKVCPKRIATWQQRVEQLSEEAIALRNRQGAIRSFETRRGMEWIQ